MKFDIAKNMYIDMIEKELLDRCLCTGYGGLTQDDVKSVMKDVREKERFGAELQIVVRGWWEPTDRGREYFYCSRCGNVTQHEEWKFCPWCGSWNETAVK